MTTTLVITTDPTVVAAVCAAVPTWTIAHAADGVTACSLVPSVAGDRAVGVLDLALTGTLDAAQTILSLHTLSPDLPLVLVGSPSATVAALQCELGCAATVAMSPDPQPLAVALQAAQAFASPLAHPGPAAYAVAQTMLAAHLRVLQQQRHQRVVVCASTQSRRLGLCQMLGMAGVPVDTSPLGGLDDLTMPPRDVRLIAVPAPDVAQLHGAFDSPQPTPLLVVVAGLQEAIMAHDFATKIANPVGIVIDHPAMTTPDRLAQVLQQLDQGISVIPSLVATPLAALHFGPQSQLVITLSIAGLSQTAIAERLGCERQAVKSSVRRVLERLDLATTRDLIAWAETWWWGQLLSYPVPEATRMVGAADLAHW